MSRHLISDDAGALIIASEVTSQAAYIKSYQRPTWPKGQSGITIGIGYDCGYQTPAQIRGDWSGKIPAAMVEVLATRAAGLKAGAAATRLAEVRPKVVVPWDAAVAVFYDVDVPRWIGKVHATVPNTELLPPDCLGALVSLAYNRGPSFKLDGDRYREMRAIRAHMIAKEFDKIPGEFRSMKRLWPGQDQRGLIIRREAEAKLFEHGLAAAPVGFLSEVDPVEAEMPVTRDPADDRHIDVHAESVPDVVDDAAAPPPAPAPVNEGDVVKGDPELYSVQRRLKAMHYSPGLLDGKWGGGTSGAISAFVNDRGGHIQVPASMDAFNVSREVIKAEIQRAESESFERPVTAARANADNTVVDEIAPEAVPAKRNRLAMMSASVVTFFGAVWSTVSDWISGAWDFFTDHKDDIPSSDSGFMSSVWEFVGKVPTPVWFGLAFVVFVLLALNAHNTVSKITSAVKTGARQ